jgi:hypothetical protein
VNRARDRREGTPAYEQFLIDRAAEAAEEQRLQAEAQANADAQNPELQFQQASNRLAEETRQVILTGYIPQSLLNVERMNGRKIVNVDAAVRNFRYFADNTPGFKKYMADALISAAERSDLAPVAPSYTALFNLMTEYNCFGEEPAQVAAPAPMEEVAPVLSRSDQAILDHQRFMEEIVGTDELGRQWTAFELDQLPAKDELRLRRLFEQGHRGSNLLTTRREILDIKQQQDAERARIAAEQNGGN